MDAVIALLLIPFTLSRQEMIGVLWLETSPLNKLVTVGPMCQVRMTLSKKYCLDEMIPLVVGAVNPDPFRLVYRWYSHSLPLCDISATEQTRQRSIGLGLALRTLTQ